MPGMADVIITENLSDEVSDAICEELRQFNMERNAAFFAARELPVHASRPLYAVARNRQGQLLGGLIAETQFAWLKVTLLAVVASARSEGTGRRLMTATEAEAVTRGCRYAYVDTMDYQAPEFYEKLGYRVVGKLEDWDSHGHAKLFLTKRLFAPTADPGRR
jgi:GNAT superfamily N-acetyltransferase